MVMVALVVFLSVTVVVKYVVFFIGGGGGSGAGVDILVYFGGSYGRCYYIDDVDVGIGDNDGDVQMMKAVIIMLVSSTS